MRLAPTQLVLLLAVGVLAGCVRMHECPSCADGRSRADLPADLAGSALDVGDASGEPSPADGRRDGPLADGPPGDGSPVPVDVAVSDLVGPDGHVPCTDYILNSNVEIVLDHGAGTIEELFYKLGSNKNVTDPLWNQQNGAGLGRLPNESGTFLVSCNVGASSATLEYVNGALYNRKTLALSWSQKGLVIDVTIKGLKAASIEWGLWSPGGAHDTTDWVRVLKSDQTTQDFKLVYPGNYQQIWSGNALGVALWDDNYDEAFGYRYPAPGRQVQIGNGASVDGPKQTFAAAGTYTFSFAIMHKADLLAWLP